VDDSDDMDQSISDKITKIQNVLPGLNVVYVPHHERLTIGGKRNMGIKRATHDIILMMDDDDHYPETSFRRRVAWLSRGDIVCCSTLPLYDLKNGTSAISVPPFHLPLSQRISEATLTFKKSAWEERAFADVSIAEAEEWIKGRESKVVEIPPQQIIIAFTHGKNQSSRVVPGAEPSCFWGFSDEYLKFIHRLAGIQVE
jgi:glycosyltransferase involved in cell wall biosynthesis